MARMRNDEMAWMTRVDEEEQRLDASQDRMTTDVGVRVDDETRKAGQRRQAAEGR